MRYVIMALTAFLALQAGSAVATTVPAAIPQGSLTSIDSLERLSVGADVELMRRKFSVDQIGSDETFSLEAMSIDGYLGLDVCSWLSFFGTAGGASLKDEESDDYSGSKSKWSAGLSLSLFKVDVKEPDYLSGRLSIRALGEYASSAAKQTGDEDGAVEWKDKRAALLIGFEFFDDMLGTRRPAYQSSLNCYAGPAYSEIEGTVEEPGEEWDFSSEKNFGFIGGADIFLVRNISIGVHAEVFDEVGVGASLRIHF